MAVVAAFEKHHALVDELLADVSAYRPNVDQDLIVRAFRYAAHAHEGQLRRSGEDFIIHPFGVAGAAFDLMAPRSLGWLMSLDLEAGISPKRLSR